MSDRVDLPDRWGGGSRWLRRGALPRIALSVAGLMAFETAVVVGTTGQAVALASRETAAERPAYATEAADLPSARVAARLSGKRVEAKSERTESTTTWVNPDGTVTTDTASGPVRFRDGANGPWRDIDVELTKRDGVVAAKSHPLGLRLGGKTPAAQAAKVRASGAAGEPGTAEVPLVTLAAGEGRELGLSWRGVLPEPTLSGTTARYADALTATDLIIESTRTGFEQFLELKNRSAVAANGSVTLTLNAKGVKARANADRSVTFLDKKTGKQVGLLPAPVMWDATVDAKSGEHTRRADVGLKVTQRGNRVDLTLTPDAKFLADPATKYPVTVDPAVNIGASFDTFVQQGYTTDMSTSTELKLGNNGAGQIARSFLHFPMAGISGKQILGAKLNLFNSHSWSCTPSSWEVWDTPHATTASRWTNQPGFTTKWATSTATKGFSSACADGWVSQDIKNLAVAWAANGNSTNSLGLKATAESDPYSWKRFNSGNAATNTPYISVTYNAVPVAGNPMTASPGRANAGKNWVTTTTPDLSYAASDAETYFLRQKWEVWEGTTNLEVYDTGTGDPVLGKTVSHQVPAGLLVNGKTYWYKGRINDGTAWSNWTPSVYFTVDTTKPAVSTVGSTDFPANTWSGSPDANGNFSGSFTFTPPATDVASVEYRLDSGAWTVATTTGAAVSKTLTFPTGKHTVTVRTKDPAGNASAEASHTFYAGSGAALLTPGQGERPARRVGLSAEGLTTYTGVTYQYRRGETDAWKAVPVADVRQGSNTVPGWPVAVTNGKPAALTWNITDTLAQDGPIEVRAAFTAGATQVYSPANEITVDRNAGTAPSEDAGPGSVNLLTGDYTLSASDASAFGLSVSRTASSRRPDARVEQPDQAPIFGPQWMSGTTAEAVMSDWDHLKATSDSSVAVVDASGTEMGFTATSKGDWAPEPGAEKWTLTGSLTGTFTLRDTTGVVTVFTKPDQAATSWQVATVGKEGGATSVATVVSETVTVNGKPLARPKRIVAPNSAAAATTCTATPSTPGCRMLEFGYATTSTATGSALGDIAGQVKEIRLWSTEPGATAATSKVVAAYRYDAQSRLREQWNPALPTSMTTRYSYDTAGRVSTIEPGSALPWSFVYGKAGNTATAGEGMLLKVSRQGLKPGTADVVEGTATSTVVYDVPLTGAAAPYKMGAADVGAWGQTDLPTDATAFFPADATPPGNAGSALTAADYRRAAITYTDASGREVNSAAPGGHITATEYDVYGNAVRELTAGNRSLALGLTEADKGRLAELGIAGLTSADRAELLATTTVYQASGTREAELYGPLHRVTLAADLTADGASFAAGTEVAARTHTVTTYDEGRPADAKVSNLPTSTVTGARVSGLTVDAETRTSKTGYDWTRGLPTSTTEDATGKKATRTTSYDTQGRATKTTLPKSDGADAGATVSTYWSATGTGPCDGRPEWADLLCSTGPAGAVTGGGDNPGQLPVKSFEYDWWGEVGAIKEVAGGKARTTRLTRDEAGRVTKVSMTGDTGTAVPDVVTTYDANTGRPATTASGGRTISTAYDRLGRVLTYDDGAGNVTTTSYDLLDRPVRVADSAPSTTVFGYDTDKEPRGLATSMTDSVAGTFTAAFGPEGQFVRGALPGGYTLTVDRDELGQETSRAYTRDSDGQVALSDSANYSIHGQILDRTKTAGETTTQRYDYDGLGRLTRADDRAGDGACTRRAYTFDANSNRTGLTTSVSASGDPCADTGASTTSYGYDSADRLVGTGVSYDEFGRTTHQASGASIEYHVNDMVRRQTSGTERQTWDLDATGRLASWTKESQGTDGTWSQFEHKINHYGTAGDSPSWIADGSGGGLVRYVRGATGTLQASTGATDGTVLQLSDIHGDVSVQLPLDPGESPTVLRQDEYGNTVSAATARYGWQGATQRSSESLTGAVLMGVRLYDPALGRFLSVDPVAGGSANAYDYAFADPVNQTDPDGRWSRYRTKYYSWGKVIGHYWKYWDGWGWDFGWHVGGSAKIKFNWWATNKIANEGPYVLTVFGFVAGVISAVGGTAGGVITGIIGAYAAWIVWWAYRAKERRKTLNLYLLVEWRGTHGVQKFYPTY
ncbi:DNRLRE domain-containing protein [Streptomyces sp. NPDC093111]|uniref:DNRLRE domain-containing protein n=1 Tax=Streptomyces sp. NPDC093111 TaxID=3154978 RepID=UPI003415D6AB